jgi:hypothetical protein
MRPPYILALHAPGARRGVRGALPARSPPTRPSRLVSVSRVRYKQSTSKHEAQGGGRGGGPPVLGAGAGGWGLGVRLGGLKSQSSKSSEPSISASLGPLACRHHGPRGAAKPLLNAKQLRLTRWGQGQGPCRQATDPFPDSRRHLRPLRSIPLRSKYQWNCIPPYGSSEARNTEPIVPRWRGQRRHRPPADRARGELIADWIARRAQPPTPSPRARGRHRHRQPPGNARGGGGTTVPLVERGAPSFAAYERGSSALAPAHHAITQARWNLPWPSVTSFWLLQAAAPTS